MNLRAGYAMALAATMLGCFSTAAWAQSGSWVLPSAAFAKGLNGAEYHTDVRILNQGTSAVTVTATFYDQVTSTAIAASPFEIGARRQMAFDNVLQSLFGKTLSQGAYGPIRLDATGPILLASNVNNVNACGSGAVSGQWLPGIATTQALKAGVIGQLAVSASTVSGYRTNLVFMNPGSVAATVTVKVRLGGGALLSTGTIGPLSANGFSQVALDSTVFPGVAGTTDTNLWLEFLSDQPVVAYATIINNASGDPFAVVASGDTPPNPFSGSYSGTYAGPETGTWTTSVYGDGTLTMNIVSPSAGSFRANGIVSQSGDMSAATGSVAGLGTVTFTGTLRLQGSGATGSGTWVASAGYSGTWSGTRLGLSKPQEGPSNRIGPLMLSGATPAGSYILPSSAFVKGLSGAEYHTDARILNQGTSAVTVTATFYDQVTSTAFSASPFEIGARRQVAFDNILQSLFGKTLNLGAYGPIRFDATGPILLASNVNNVNACGSGAVSGQWLPGIAASQALKAGVIGQLAVSASTNSGYRTNLVFMNPGSAAATATVKVRQGAGALLSTGTIGPLAANGFSQVALDSAVFPGVAGTTDTNLWLEFTSDQPVLAYATMINNASGDPFAVVATSDAAGGAGIPHFISDPCAGDCSLSVVNYDGGRVTGITYFFYVKNSGDPGTIHVAVTAGSYTEEEQFTVKGNARYKLSSTVPVVAGSGTPGQRIVISASFPGITVENGTSAAPGSSGSWIGYSFTGTPVSTLAEVLGGDEVLAADDGSIEMAFRADGDFVVNRLTPARYPATLKSIRFYLAHYGGLPDPMGTPVRVVAFLDPAGQGTPPTGSTFAVDQTISLPAVPGGVAGWVDLVSPTGVVVTSGDIYVGLRSPSSASGVLFPADTDGTPANRSFISDDGGATFQGLVVVDDNGNRFPANVMIRAVASE